MESDSYEPDVIERVIPTENIQLMFHYKHPFVLLNSSEKAKIQPRSIISGLSDSFSDVTTNGETGVVFITFFPTGACRFFDFPLSEIENLSLDMADIFKSEIRQLEEFLFLADSIREKVNIIENFLLLRYSPISLHDDILISKGLEIVKNCKGPVNAKYLSESLFTSPKTLERKFSRYIGKTTKQVIKLMRFQEVLKGFSAYNAVSLTEYAYNYGYFDQSHFIHDFKTYTGYTPGEFLTRYPCYNNDGNSC
jgi:AraC-like DNA-binding protein